jgi:hypothetical protein
MAIPAFHEPFADLLATIVDGNIRVQFRRSAAGAVEHRWELCASGCSVWSTWRSLGAPAGTQVLGTPFPVRTTDGRLTVFAVFGDRQLWHRWQLCDGCDWSAWTNLGGGLASNPWVVLKTDGTMVAFALAFDLDLWHKWQVCAGCTWSEWNSLSGGRFASYPEAGRFTDNRLFAKVWHENGHQLYNQQDCVGCAWRKPAQDWLVLQ